MRKIFPLERLSERVGDAAGDVCRLISHRMDGCVIDATLIDEDWTSEVRLIKSPARAMVGLEEVYIDSNKLSLV